MSDVPLWIQTLQALATPTIAVGVGSIAFLQWRTAHHKMVMDLFDRRFQAYQDLMQVAAAFTHKGQLTREETVQLNDVFRRSAFLFGEDAFSRINRFYSAVDGADYFPNLELDGDDVSEKWQEAFRERQYAVFEFVRDCPIFLEPYMRLKQRQLRTPSEWFANANRRRLAHADDKQK